MPNNDVCLKINEGVFNYCVRAIIIHAGNILMVKNSGDSFYYPIGGRVKFGESAHEAVLREAFEETGIKMEIEGLAFIHENFFSLDKTEESFQEIGFYFLMKPCSELENLKGGKFNEEYGEVTLHWLPVESLNGLRLYPEFFKTELNYINTGQIVHFITRNEITTKNT